MQPFTLKQAVEQSKKAKSTVLDAIKNGKLSATKDENGRYQIDPSELFRVYPPTSNRPDEKTTFDQKNDQADRAIFELKIENLRQQLDREKDLNKDLSKRFESLENRLDSLMLLLTHQKEMKEKTTKTSKLYEKIFGKMNRKK
jgi:hypothetical protein